MALLAESLSTLSWAALILSVSLCFMPEREKRGERGREKSLFLLTCLGPRRRSLRDPSLRGVNQQVGAKSLTSFMGRFYKPFGSQTTKQCSAGEEPWEKLAQRSSHLVSDNKERAKGERSESDRQQVLLFSSLKKKQAKWLHCRCYSYALNFALNAFGKKGGNYAFMPSTNSIQLAN